MSEEPRYREFRQTCNAIISGWDVSDDIKTKAVKRITEALGRKGLSVRDRDRATRALVSIERLKLEAAKAQFAAENSQPRIIYQAAPDDKAESTQAIRNAHPTIRERYLAMYAMALQRATKQIPELAISNTFSDVIEFLSPSEAMIMGLLWMAVQDPMRSDAIIQSTNHAFQPPEPPALLPAGGSHS